MGEFFFVLKALVMTVVLVLCMQIKIGHETIERKSLDWMHESVAVSALRGVADGAIAIVEDGITWTKHMYKKNIGGSSAAVPRHTSENHTTRAQRQKAWNEETQKSTSDEPDAD